MIKWLLRMLAYLTPAPDFDSKPTLRDEMEEKRARIRLMSGHHL